MFNRKARKAKKKTFLICIHQLDQFKKTTKKEKKSYVIWFEANLKTLKNE
jgi:hypothetical protein